MKDRITRAVTDAHDLGYDLHFERFFFVERFLETDYRKVPCGSLMGIKSFNLAEVLGVKDLPDTKAISDTLRDHTWE